MNSIVSLFSEEAQEKGVTIDLGRLQFNSGTNSKGKKRAAGSSDQSNLDTKPIPTLCGENCRVLQILANLIKISLGSTNHGDYIYVRYGYEYSEQMLTIMVEDTGFGIDQLDLNHIFNTRKTKRTMHYNHADMLYNLILVQALRKKVGGVLNVHSDGLGFGTKFTFMVQMQCYEPRISTPEEELNSNTDTSK